MNTFRTDSPTTEPTGSQRDSRTVGVMLVGLGVVFLAAQLFNLGAWVLPILAVGFLGLGIAQRSAGWMIPGGVLAGISLGILLIERGVATGEAEGGAFLLAFAAGWAVVYLASRLFTDEPQTWALIPGGIMALIGGAVLLGAAGLAWPLVVLEASGIIWPLALVGAGAYIFIRSRK